MKKIVTLLILMIGVSLLLGSCRKDPDWSGKERDERLLGKWYKRDKDNTYSLYYEFFADGHVYNTGSKGQYYTSNKQLYMYYSHGWKIAPTNEHYYYRFLNDTLYIWYGLGKPLPLVRNPN